MAQASSGKTRSQVKEGGSKDSRRRGRQARLQKGHAVPLASPNDAEGASVRKRKKPFVL